MNPDDLKAAGFEKILKRLDSLEERIARLESYKGQFKQVQTVPGKGTEDEDSVSVNSNISLNSPSETRLGN